MPDEPTLSRRSFAALAAAGLLGLPAARAAAPPVPPDPSPSPRPPDGHPGSAVPGGCRVLVWDERQPEQERAYENGLGNAIAEYLRNQPGVGARSVALDDPDQGLSHENLKACDVLVWWGNARHREVTHETAMRIVDRIRGGRLSLVALHSAHWSMPFVRAMWSRAADDALAHLGAGGAAVPPLRYAVPPPMRPPAWGDPVPPPIAVVRGGGDFVPGADHVVHLPSCGFPSWRADGKPSRVTVLAPDHPIAKDLPPTFEIPQTEMYAGPFHVPPPDATIFEERWEAGESFRSGLVWNLGKGKVFYFRPGHETYGVYKEPLPLKVIENACRWLAAEQAKAVAGG